MGGVHDSDAAQYGTDREKEMAGGDEEEEGEEEEEEEDLFKGDSPLSLQATAQLSRAVVSASAIKHRAGVRATIPAVQVRGECSCGAGRGSPSARLGPHGWPE